MLKIQTIVAGTLFSAVCAFAQSYQPLSQEARQAADLEMRYRQTKSSLESAMFNAQRDYDLCKQRVQSSPNGNPHACDNYLNQVIRFQQLLNSLVPPATMQQQPYQPYANQQPMTTNTNALNNQYQQWQQNQQWNQNQNYPQQQQQPQYSQQYQPYSNPQPMTTNTNALNNQYQQWQQNQNYGQQQPRYTTQPYQQPYQPYMNSRPMTTNTNTLNNQYQQWQGLQQQRTVRPRANNGR